MPPIFQETQAYAAGGQGAPINIASIHALEGIQLDVTGTLTVGVAAATLTSAGILALIRRIEFSVGGVVEHGIGLEGALPALQILEALDRGWFAALPNVAQPAVGVAANAFSASIVIPFKGSEYLHKHLTPEERDLMCFRRNGRTCQLSMQFGTDANMATPGGGGTAVVAANVRVTLLERRDLDAVPLVEPTTGEDPLNRYHRFSTESVPVSAAVAAAEQQRINLGRGLAPGFMIYAFDNGSASNVWLNALQVLLNGNDQRFNSTWDGMVNQTRELFGGQLALPAGFNFVWFDTARDGGGYLPLGAANVASSMVQLDHDVSVGGVLRFAIFHMQLI